MPRLIVSFIRQCPASTGQVALNVGGDYRTPNLSTNKINGKKL